MGFVQRSGILLTSFILCMVDSRGIAGNVKLVAMNGNQYWFSTSSPYAPTLNFHLAYQYCRTLGLQLVVLETTEEVETISAFLNRDANPSTHGKYWTSGNRLGSLEWIWISSGEQMNSSFADYWLKNGVGAATPENPRHCMSMKPPISPMTKRAIFTAEECNKSLPFICEQVRCLYYNYPVYMFPDPSELRTDIEDGGTPTSPSESGSESRTSIQFSTSEKIQHPNLLISDGRNQKSTLTDIEEESSGIDTNSKSQPLQKRMTLRPVMSVYPISSHSYNKYKLSEIPTPSTKRPPSFYKKTTQNSLWGPNSVPSEDSTNNINKSNAESFLSSTTPITHYALAKLRKNGETLSLFNKKPRPTATTYITAGKVVKPNSNNNNSSSTGTKRGSSINSREVETTPKPFTQFEIVTSKSTTVDGEEIDDLEDTVAATMLYHRYGSGSNPSDPTQIFASGYVSTDSSIAGFDDEQNNVGGEVGLEEATTLTPFYSGGVMPKFFQGSGIRRPDMTSSSTARFSNQQEGEEVTTNLYPNLSYNSRNGNREASQPQSPAKMKQYTFQRGNKPSSLSSSGSSWGNAKAKREKSAFTSSEIIADTSSSSGTEKMGLGPRLGHTTYN